MSRVTFDPTKPCRTRDGRAVTILTTCRKGGNRPIIALVKSHDGKQEKVQQYYKDGTLNYDLSNSLINIPEEHTLWVNIYHVGSGFKPGLRLYQSRAEAMNVAMDENGAFVGAFTVTFEVK